jgi:lactoylglutathione lyase
VKLYAVRVFARDWDRLCDFYRDTLALPERIRNADIGWAEYDVGGPCFGIERVTPEDTEADDLIGRSLAVSLQVDDVQATYRALTERGVEFLAPPERQPWGGTLAHFRDPEGNVLTLLG